MIKEKNSLFSRIENYSLNQNTQDNYENKINSLEKAIDNSVKKILKENSEIHLAYSGGIDSSLILIKILKQYPNLSLFAHTIGSESEPDILYSQKSVQKLKKRYKNLKHVLHIKNISDEDINKSNEILGLNQDFPDNYYMLMNAITPHIKKIICCDCIDELLAGYYAHRNPKEHFINYDPEKSLEENRIGALNYFMSRLIPDHLSILDKFSSYFDIKVSLPYGGKEVINSCSKFNINELVDDVNRKKPIYKIGQRNNISREILERRKYGLVSAFNVHICG